MPFIGISFDSLEAIVSGESWGAEPSLIPPMPRAIRGILNLTEASSLDARIHTLHSVIASLEQLSNTIEFPSIQTSSAARKRADGEERRGYR